MKLEVLLTTVLAISYLKVEISCLSRRCIQCRSRGELGSCGDPLPFNISDPEAEHGVHITACPSGWCAKRIQGTTGTFRTDDYGAVTERSCLQQPPSDYEERCAYTMWKYKRVYVCFCNGDLCNSAPTMKMFSPVLLLSIFIFINNYIY